MPAPESEERPLSDVPPDGPGSAGVPHPAARARFFGRNGWVLLFLLVALPAAVYSNSLGGAWLLDDGFRIHRNPELERVWPPWRHFVDEKTMATLPSLRSYRPMLPLSLSLNHAVADRLGVERKAALHVGNLAIHLASTVLLYLLFQALLSLGAGPVVPEALRNPAAFFAALLWAVHPVSGIPVNYLSGRDLLMAELFSVAAMLVYVRMRKQGFRLGGCLGCGLLFGLAFCSKETAIGLVPLIACFELLLAPARPGGSSRRGILATTVLLPLAVVIWKRERFTGQFSIDYGLAQLANHLWHYPLNAVWPFQARLLPFIEPPASLFEPAVLSGLVFVLATLVVAWRWRRSRPLAAFLILAYWALFSPTSSAIFIRELANDYRQYPPLAPLCLLVVLPLFTRLGPRLAVGIATAAVLGLGAASYGMNTLYADEETYWSYVVRHGGTPTAMLALARVIEAEDPERAEGLLLRALEIQPTHFYVHINLGILQMRDGRTEEGLALVEKAVELAPEKAITHHYLGKVYNSIGRLEDAQRESQLAADLNRHDMEYALNAGFYLARVGEFESALRYLARVADYSPEYSRAVFLEGLALQSLDRLAEAEERFRYVVDREPWEASAQFHLGTVLMAQGRLPEAIERFEKVIELGRGPIESARESLALAHAMLGNEDEAARLGFVIEVVPESETVPESEPVPQP